MNEGLIPRRYAKALYKVAVERGDSDRLYILMDRLSEIARTESSIVDTIANPFVSVNDKCDLLKTAAGEGSDNATFVDFLKLLADNRRLDMVFAIARDYAALYRQQNNIYKVDGVSAAKMESVEEERLKKIIEQNINGGTMEYSCRVNPDLIGGFTVTIDNRKLDASVSNELKQLRVNLLK